MVWDQHWLKLYSWGHHWLNPICHRVKWMVNIEETFACGKFIIRINSSQPSDSKKHSDGGAKGKEDLWFVVEPGVFYRHLPNANIQIVTIFLGDVYLRG